MLLSKYIEQTLSEIILGVSGAQVVAANHGASINPANKIGSEPVNYPVNVAFTVDLIIEENGSAETGASIKVFSVFEGKAGAGLSRKEIGRSGITFSVPLQLPLGENRGYFVATDNRATVAFASF